MSGPEAENPSASFFHFTTSLPIKFPSSKVHTCTPANSIFYGPIGNLLLMLGILIEIFFMCSCEGEKGLIDFTFGIFIGRFSSE